jgi:hypothetical protein
MSEIAPQPRAADLHPATQIGLKPERSDFWISVWLGTSLAGGLFGLLLGLTFFAHEGPGGTIAGMFIGPVVGCLYAGFVAVPVVLVMATASWAIGKRRWRWFLAAAAGGVTGILCTLRMASSGDTALLPLPGIAITSAALLGSVGAWVSDWPNTSCQP